MALFARRDNRFSSLAKAAAAGLVLAALLTTLLIAGPFALDPARAVPSGALSQKLEDVRSELRKIRTNIQNAETTKKAALDDISALDQDIDGLEAEVAKATTARDAAAEKLAALSEQRDQVTTELNRKRDELGQTERDLQGQQNVFNDRVANVYKSGGRVVYLAALLEPHSLAELVGRIDLLSAIVGHDSKILGQIKTLKTRVEEQKLVLEDTRARVAVLERDQRAATQELQAVVSDRQASLGKLESARTAKGKVVAAAEKDQAAWNKQENQLLAESDRVAGLLRSASAKAPVKAGSGVLSWPVNGAVTSGFGYRMHPIFHVRKMHTGIDISAGMGAPIKAASAGTVVSAGWRGGYGKCVVISHAGSLATLYAHQSEILVSVGETVKRGDVIGKVGSTGYSTGPHLHFEVRVNGSPVDPLGYL